MKVSLYMLTACSAACLVRIDGLTSPHGLSTGENQIYIFYTQGMVEKYFMQVNPLLKDCLAVIAEGISYLCQSLLLSHN